MKLSPFMTLILIVGGIYLVSTQTDLLSIVTGDTFVKPLWARLECLPADVYSGKESISIPKAGNSVYCGQGEFTDSCKIYATNIPEFWLTQNVKIRYKMCNNDGSSCDPSVSTITVRQGVQEQLIKEILAGKKLFVYYEMGLFNVNVEGTARKEYRPWSLYDFYGGGAKRQITAQDCTVPSSSLSNILKGDERTRLYIGDGGEGIKWINYVHDWVYGPGTNVVTHPQYGEVYCTNNGIYSIVKVTTANNQIKKLDPTYTGTAPDGTTFKGLGTALGRVECCPGTYLCGDDFKFKQATQQECTLDAQCASGGQTICKTSTSTTRWACVSNKCVEQTIQNVECCDTNACGSGRVCDFSTYKCIQQSGSTYCGDNTCQANENVNSCTRDCGQNKPAIPSWIWWVLGILGLFVILVSPIGKKLFKMVGLR